MMFFGNSIVDRLDMYQGTTLIFLKDYLDIYQRRHRLNIMRSDREIDPYQQAG
jgi:hypothetical protein